MRVVIFAAGGLGKVICEALELEGAHEITGFFDDAKKGKFCGYPILGKCSQYKTLCQKLKIEAAIVAFGYHFLNKRLLYCKKINGEKTIDSVNVIHPSAIISLEAKLGRGIYIGPGVIINPGARVGDNSIIWSGTVIEHDNLIGKNVFVAPGVNTAGYTKIGDSSFIGMGANIAKAEIGKNVTVAAGSLVLKDVKSNKYISGIPARIIREKRKASYV